VFAGEENMAIDSPSTLPIDVLVVEDDVALSTAIVSYLTKAGLTVRAAHTGSMAFRVLEGHAPRIAVLDYNLPDISGLDIAFRLRGLLPHLPILLMSGAALEGLEERESLEKAGIKVFVNKPLPLAALYRAVRELIQ
jgi:DNA-binding response OmpR family regulator